MLWLCATKRKRETLIGPLTVSALGGYDAALFSVVFMFVHIVFTLLPTLDNRTIAATATKTNRRAYSTKSWPLSSSQSFLTRKPMTCFTSSDSFFEEFNFTFNKLFSWRGEAAKHCLSYLVVVTATLQTNGRTRMNATVSKHVTAISRSSQKLKDS